MTRSAWLIFTVIVAGIMGGLVFNSKNSSDKIDVSKIDVAKIQTASESSGNIADRVLGNPESKVVLIEYGDFQCPACANENPKIMKVVEGYKDKIAFVFRNFPLTAIHANAKAAAAAAESAGLQNKYWEMHEILYKSQSKWDSLSGEERTKAFVSYAEELKLDIEKFKSDMGLETVNKKINFDKALGQKINLNGTPSFVLNGQTLSNETWSDETKLRKEIDSKL